MFQNITGLVCSNKRAICFYFLFSLLLCSLTFPLGLYAYLVRDLENRTLSAESALINRMNSIFIELKTVSNNAKASCNSEDIKRIRRSTFYSSTFKEFGLFDDGFRVYCTDYGETDFSIYTSIINRINQSPERTTVSLVKTYTLGEKALLVFYQGENGLGANGLAPRGSLGEDIDRWLLPDFPYKLTLGKLELISNEHKEASKILDTQVVSLDNWAMKLEVFLPSYLYWQCFFYLLPFVIIAFFLVSVTLCVLHWCVVYHRHSLRYCLRIAIKNHDMEVYYQPIVSLNEAGIHDMEALIRWRSPYHGQVSALSIIEVADQLNLLDDLTWMVIRKVGAFYRENFILLKDIKIAVNVDRHSFLSEDFVATLTDILDEYPELENRLGLEVTETSALNMTELPTMVSRFDHIKALGIHLSVDDFGTGYSGLDFLRRFPYDTLKLDKVFISTLKEDPFTRQVLTSVTTLAKELNMEVVAEGVERKDQLDAVKALGVDKVQGYYFCSPLSKEKLISWITENHVV